MNKTYATFGIERSIQQITAAIKQRKRTEEDIRYLYEWIKSQEMLIEQLLGRPVENLRILEVGPGQRMQRALYFGIKNQVVGIDLDLIRQHYQITDYYQMYKLNGLGRVLKTIGWKVISQRPQERAWEKVLGTRKLKYPQVMYGDICQTAPEENNFDLAVSWSVFEHLPNPKAALQNMVKTLRPGGVLFISIHLFTSVNGHHDMRAFTGRLDTLPLWGHLRPSTEHFITPSAYLNKLRLEEWRHVFNEVTPGYNEVLEAGDVPGRYGAQLTGGLREELKEYSDEELLSVNAIYLWKKPGC